MDWIKVGRFFGSCGTGVHLAAGSGQALSPDLAGRIMPPEGPIVERGAFLGVPSQGGGVAGGQLWYYWRCLNATVPSAGQNMQGVQPSPCTGISARAWWEVSGRSGGL